MPWEQAHSIEVGSELADDAVVRLDHIDQYFRGKEKALRLLAIRARTRSELDTALARIAVEDSIRAGLLSELEEQGFVDDLKFAREYVREKTELKLWGPHRLRFQLGKLGVSAGIVRRVLGESADTDAQESMAWRAVERKVGNGPIDEKVVRRVQGFLRRRGFDYEVVNRVAYELLRRANRER